MMLLNAALDSMPYGFSIWDQAAAPSSGTGRYAEFCRLPGSCLRLGMPLPEVRDMTVATGNHPGISAAEPLYVIYRRRLVRRRRPGDGRL